MQTNKQTNKALTRMGQRRKHQYSNTWRNRTDNQSRARNFFTTGHHQKTAPVNNNITTLASAQTVEALVENNVSTLVVHDPDIEGKTLAVYDPDAKRDQIDDQKENKRDWLTQHVNRLLISRYYSEALSSPLPSEWNGRGGTFGSINIVFPSLSLNLIKSVVKETYEGGNRGNTYMGFRKKRNSKALTLSLIGLCMRE